MEIKTALNRMFINSNNSCFIPPEQRTKFFMQPENLHVKPSKKLTSKNQQSNTRPNKPESSKCNQSQSKEKH